MKKEQFSTKFGLVLLSAGSAIGLGNIWRFPYMVGKYGGAIFVLIYLAFLILLGIPILNIELAVGRGSQFAPVKSFKVLARDKKWAKAGWISFIGPYILMFFYVVIAGWLINYAYMFLSGRISSQSDVANLFSTVVANPQQMAFYTFFITVLAFGILAIGFNKGVEKITSKMMVLLFVSISLLVVHSLSLENGMEGFVFYLVPDFESIKHVGILRVIYEAMNQAFFTLSIGIGSIAIFGSRANKNRTLFSESLYIVVLDTLIAIMAGLMIFPATTAYDIDAKAGPGLVFVVMPEVFKNLPKGILWGSLFFIFMTFAALSTVIAVFEEIIGNFTEVFNFSRKKAIIINLFIVLLGSLPVILGFNVWSSFQPLGEGTNFLDLYDFIISSNLLPIGAVTYIFFSVSKSGWGYDKLVGEINTGRGLKFPIKLESYIRYVLPAMISIIWLMGYILLFS